MFVQNVRHYASSLQNLIQRGAYIRESDNTRSTGFVTTKKLKLKVLYLFNQTMAEAAPKFGIRPQHYTSSQPRRWRQHGPPKFGILSQHYMLSQPKRWRQQGPSKILVSYHNTKSRHNPEDGSSMDLRKVGILPQNYTSSQHRRWRQHGSPKRWYPTTTQHNTTQHVVITQDLDFLNSQGYENLKSRATSLKLSNYLLIDASLLFTYPNYRERVLKYSKVFSMRHTHHTNVTHLKH
jgi:hypothetical protein